MPIATTLDDATLDDPRDELCRILSVDDPAPPLWDAVHDGRMDQIVPEFAALEMEQDPDHRHKDVLWHTIVVVSLAPNDLIVRLAALFHDIGKPKTRSFEGGEVTFRHHEAVGARMTRERMTQLGFDDDTTEAVSELVRLSGRFKGYDQSWSDSAVRRYARDAGGLLGQLNALVRADCTTRNERKRAALHRQVDDLEARVAQLAAEERKAKERPQLDGDAVMKHLGIGPGPEVGKALKWLLDLKRSEGNLPSDVLLTRLNTWWENNKLN